MWELTFSAGARGGSGSGSGRLCPNGFHGQSFWSGAKPTEAEAGQVHASRLLFEAQLVFEDYGMQSVTLVKCGVYSDAVKYH